MKRQFLVVGLVLALITLGAATLPTTAYAEAPCYTGCTTSVTGTPTPPASVVAPPVKAATSSGGLVLTGADIEVLVIVGFGTLVVGGLLVRRNHRRHRVGA